MCCMHVQLISLYLLLSVYHVALITVNYMYLLRQLYQILSLYLPSPFSLLSLSLCLCVGISSMVTGRMTHMTSILS